MAFCPLLTNIVMLAKNLSLASLSTRSSSHLEAAFLGNESFSNRVIRDYSQVQQQVCNLKMIDADGFPMYLYLLQPCLLEE